MKKRNLTIVANWKSNPESLGRARTLFRGVKKATKNLRGVEVVVCAPFVYLTELSKLTKGNILRIGAQDISLFEGGAHTGEVSPQMLLGLGVETIIVGHSERRDAGESEKNINEKIKMALKYGLGVVVCVGEKVRDKDGIYFSVVKSQLEHALKNVPRTKISKVVIAYEPVWAVGRKAKGIDTPEDFIEMSIFIRKILNTLYGKQNAMSTTILYGGSIDDKNAEGFLIRKEVSGLLVGRASLDENKFKEILTLAQALR